jgi:hypothetical protein
MCPGALRTSEIPRKGCAQMADIHWITAANPPSQQALSNPIAAVDKVVELLHHSPQIFDPPLLLLFMAAHRPGPIL